MDDAFVLDGETNYTYPQLLDLIEQHGSVILTIQFIAIEPLKSALAIDILCFCPLQISFIFSYIHTVTV